MKLISYKNWLNEVFIEDSDPISDMGIGLIGIYNNLRVGMVFQVAKYMNTHLPNVGYYIVITSIQEKPKEEWDKRVDIKIYKNKSDILKNKNIGIIDSWGWKYKFVKEYLKFVGELPLEESLNEKFTEDGDPIHDLGIGLKHKIKEWLDENNETHFGGAYNPYMKYRINKNFTISIYQDSFLPDNCGNLPEYINFKYVNGGFSVDRCNLTSFKGLPRKIVGSFYCQDNPKLKSLEFMPKYIGGNCIFKNIRIDITEEEVRAISKIKGAVVIY